MKSLPLAFLAAAFSSVDHSVTTVTGLVAIVPLSRTRQRLIIPAIFVPSRQSSFLVCLSVVAGWWAIV